MTKKTISILCAVLIALLVAAGLALSAVGISPFALGDNLRLLNGLTAKLACSGRFVSGFDEAHIRADILQYSPALSAVSLSWHANGVTADTWGFGTVRADFRPGLGCTLDIDASAELDEVQVPALIPLQAQQLWPAGSATRPIVTTVQAQLDATLAADNAAGLDTRALLVAHQGQLVAEGYGPGYTPHTPLLGWSMGKSLIAALLGTLHAQGELAADEVNLYPQWANDARRELTLEHLLRMSSGLAFDENYGTASDATEMLFYAPNVPAVPRRQPLEHSPGTHFSYSSGTTNLLSEIYMRAHGDLQAALNALHRDLLAPLGMRNTIVEPGPDGTFVGSSYVFASARDWGRLGLLLVQNGRINGAQVLAPAWVTALRIPNESSNDTRYGYQVWLNSGRNGESLRWPDLPEDAYAMMGNRAQVVMMVPSRQAVLVRLGWSAGAYPTSENFAALLATLPATTQ